MAAETSKRPVRMQITAAAPGELEITRTEIVVYEEDIGRVHEAPAS